VSGISSGLNTLGGRELKRWTSYLGTELGGPAAGIGGAATDALAALVAARAASVAAEAA
jgi:hypothetical protein